MSAAPAVVTAVVLCGGDARRMGSDKTAAPLGPATVLDHLLDALPDPWTVVAVGPERRTSRPVRWARESPPGGGPVAALAAALPLVATGVAVVLAGDLPFAGGAASRLATALGEDPHTDAVVAVDPAGIPNPLLAAYRTNRLREALPSPPQGAPARALLALTHTRVPVSEEEAIDVDTQEALGRARHRLEP